MQFFGLEFFVAFDRFDGAFGLAHAAIDAFIGVDDQHVFALVEAVDGADFDAIGVAAFDAFSGDDEGHFVVFRLVLADFLFRASVGAWQQVARLVEGLGAFGGRRGGGFWLEWGQQWEKCCCFY